MKLKFKLRYLAEAIIFGYFYAILCDALYIGLQNILALSAIGYTAIARDNGLRLAIQKPYALWLMSFTLFIWLGLLWSNSTASVLNMGKTYTKMCIMLLFIYIHTNSFDKLILRIKQFMVAAVIMMLKVVFANLSGQSRLNSFTYGVGLHFNSVAQILAFSIILVFWFFFVPRKKKKSGFLPYAAYVLAAYAMIIWSGSRKSILIPVVGIMFVLIVGEFGLKRRLRYFMLAALAGLAALYVIASNELLAARFMDLFNSMFKGMETDVSEVERRYFRGLALSLFAQNPIVGLGADGFMNHLAQSGYSHVAYCHNNWLEVLSAFGIVGGGIYYAYYVYAMLRLRKYKSVNQQFSVFLLATLIVLIAFEYGIVTYYFPMYHVLICFAAIYFRCNVRKTEKGRING